MLEKLSAAKKHGSAFLAGAKAAFVILGIPGESDVWIEDTSIAASNMLLEAEALDLGACWIQIRERFDKQGTSSQEVVQELLGIPESRSVEAIIAVGHPAEKKNGYQAEDLLWDKVFIGHWGHER
jgi:nitroreductase